MATSTWATTGTNTIPPGYTGQAWTTFVQTIVSSSISGGGSGQWIVDDTFAAATGTQVSPSPRDRIVLREVMPKALAIGQEADISLPDGSRFIFERDGKFRIEDSAAKIIYRANRHRDFNKYMNASELLEEFIGYVGGLKLDKKQVLGLPLELFIAYVIIRAAEADGDDVPEAEKNRLQFAAQHLLNPVPPPPPDANPHHCPACGRFVQKRLATQGFAFCNPEHATKQYQRLMRPVAGKQLALTV